MHYLYNFSANLKLFPNKKLKRNAYKALGTVSRSRRFLKKVSYHHHDDTLIDSLQLYAAAAAAKSLQSCPTLCDPIDGSPPGSPVPGILQARATL